MTFQMIATSNDISNGVYSRPRSPPPLLNVYTLKTTLLIFRIGIVMKELSCI